jgi:hypothetical protein
VLLCTSSSYPGSYPEYTLLLRTLPLLLLGPAPGSIRPARALAAASAGSYVLLCSEGGRDCCCCCCCCCCCRGMLLVTLLLKPWVGAEEGSWRLPLLNGTYLQGQHSTHTTMRHTRTCHMLLGLAQSHSQAKNTCRQRSRVRMQKKMQTA